MEEKLRMIAERKAKEYMQEAATVKDVLSKMVNVLNKDSTPFCIGNPTLDNLKGYYIYLEAKADVYEKFSRDSDDDIIGMYTDVCTTEEELDSQATIIALFGIRYIDSNELVKIMSQYKEDSINMYVGTLMFGEILKKSQSREEAISVFKDQLVQMSSVIHGEGEKQ